MPTAPALDAFAHLREQSEAWARALAPMQQQADALSRHFAQQQRTLDAATSLLGSIDAQTSRNLQHLQAESRSIARDNSDLARRVNALLRSARKRSRFYLHLVAAALAGDGQALAELQELALTEELAACALALALELDALTERVRVLVETVAQTLTAAALEALDDTDAAPPPRNRLAGTVEPNSPPRETVCASEAARQGHSLDFPARKDALAI